MMTIGIVIEYSFGDKASVNDSLRLCFTVFLFILEGCEALKLFFKFKCWSLLKRTLRDRSLDVEAYLPLVVTSNAAFLFAHPTAFGNSIRNLLVYITVLLQFILTFHCEDGTFFCSFSCYPDFSPKISPCVFCILNNTCYIQLPTFECRLI